MPDMTLSFRLPEEQDDATRTMHAHVAWAALEEIRTVIKAAEKTDRDLVHVVADVRSVALGALAALG